LYDPLMLFPSPCLCVFGVCPALRWCLAVYGAFVLASVAAVCARSGVAPCRPLAAFLLRAGLLCFSWFFMLFCYVLLPFVGCFLY
jgi:hypothetical protein